MYNNKDKIRMVTLLSSSFFVLLYAVSPYISNNIDQTNDIEDFIKPLNSSNEEKKKQFSFSNNEDTIDAKERFFFCKFK